jgi:subtilisin family serine protease
VLGAFLVLAMGVPAAPVVPGYHGLVPGGKVVGQVLVDTENGKTGSFVILLSDRAEVQSAHAISDQSARGWKVFNQLRNKAQQSQRPLDTLLTARGSPHRSYWAANAIVAEGGRDLVAQLARRPDVRAIEANDPVPGPKAIEPPELAEQPAIASTGVTEPVEWGVANVRAPQVWALGHTGEGIVVASGDTGVKWDHPAIINMYRGWDGEHADHNYSWHDAIHDSVGNPCGNDSKFPCDDDRHGTHTTGTMVGDDGGANKIGVAPGAKWVGCRNMDRGDGTPERYTECFQFFIAPTDLAGQNPNPDLRPHVINNSWGCPPSEGCAPLTLQQIVENTEAAGILVVASAGNKGRSGCATVVDPPAIYEASFSVGAYDINNALAVFSSRGPVAIDGSNRVKPNLSAPGVAVRSAVIPDGYRNLNGTSMAGPHVAGTVALLWSARPELKRKIARTKQILEETANSDLTVPTGPQTCGETTIRDIPNNLFGHGRVDALAAVNFRPSQ